MTKTIHDFASEPNPEDVTAEALIRYDLVHAAWHWARVNTPFADMPKVEHDAALYAVGGSYATARALIELRNTAGTEAADALARHLYEAAVSGEVGEWIWHHLDSYADIDADEVIAAGEASARDGAA